MIRSSGRTPLSSVRALNIQQGNTSVPKADVTNAPELMGDIYGDVEDGDAYEDGDIYGDPQSTAALDTYNTLIGDVDGAETGAPKWWQTVKKGLPYLAAAGAGYGIAKIGQRKRTQNAVDAALKANAVQNTIANQVKARRLMGKLPKGAPMPFYGAVGATLNSFPLAPTEVFAADTLKYNMDRQATDTPFEVEISSGTFAGSTWTLTAPGVATPRYYTAVFVTVGISVLTASPGTIFQLTGTMPTINGSLSISTNPFSFTLREGYYAKLVIFPWQLVTNKPLLALGQYSNANPITFAITGLPSNATVNMVVPGSLHVWSIGMRNRLL